jgi:hypothetical protein
VLGVIREKKLPAFWGEEGVNLFYLWTDPNGKPVGWSTRTRGLVARGYRGKRIERIGSRFQREVWQVDQSGRTSRYLGRDSVIFRQAGSRIPLLRSMSETSILFRDGQVEVGQAGPQGGRSATVAAPANYIPEGLNELAYYLTSLDNRRAAFTEINDGIAIVQGKPHFTPITVVPDGRGKVILATQFPNGQHEERMEFDSKGEVLRGTRPGSGLSFERTTLDVVKKTFPDVELFLRLEAAESQEE